MPYPKADVDSLYDFDDVQSNHGRRRSPSPRRRRSPSPRRRSPSPRRRSPSPRRGGRRRSLSRSPSPVNSYTEYSDSFVSDDDAPRRKDPPRAAPRRGGGAGSRVARGRGRGSRHVTPRSELVAMADNVTKRMLSARRVKINDLRSELQDALRQMDELRDENRLLRKLERRQGRALDKFDREENELPNMLRQHSDEVRVLKEQVRKHRQRNEDAASRLKQKDRELQKLDSELSRMRKLNEDKQLLERGDLNRKLVAAETELGEVEAKYKDLKKHVEHLSKNHRHELGIELARHKETQKQLREARDEQTRLQELLKEREKELEMRNIYSNRLGGGRPQGSTATTPLPAYGDTPRKAVRRRSGSLPRPSPRVAPREKARQFEEKRREEERRKRESRITRQPAEFLRDAKPNDSAPPPPRSPPTVRRRRSPSPAPRHSASPIPSEPENEWEKWEREEKERHEKRKQEKREQEEDNQKLAEAAERRRREREEQEERERRERRQQQQQEQEERDAREREQQQRREREAKEQREREQEEENRRDQERMRQKSENQKHSEEERLRADEERRKKDLLLARMREIDEQENTGSKTWKNSKDETKETFERMYQGKPAYDEMSSSSAGKTKQNSLSLFEDDDVGKAPSHGRRAGDNTKKSDLISDLFGDSANKTTKKDDDIFANDFGKSGAKKTSTRRQTGSKAPWDDDDLELGTGYTPSGATASKSTAKTAKTSAAGNAGGAGSNSKPDKVTYDFGDSFFDTMNGNSGDKLLSRRSNQPSTTFSSRPVVSAVDPNDDDLEELTL